MANYPKECPVFEVVVSGFHSFLRGCHVEGSIRDEGEVLHRLRGFPTPYGDDAGFPFTPAELRPLTLAARQMLALVR